MTKLAKNSKKADGQGLVPLKEDDGNAKGPEVFNVREAVNERSGTAVDETRQTNETPQNESKTLTLFQKKMVAVLALVSFLNGSMNAVLLPFFPVEVASRGISQTTISTVFSSFAITKMMISPSS